MSDQKPETQQSFLHRKLRQYEMAERLGDVGHWYWLVDSPTVKWSPQTFRIHRLEPQTEGVALERTIEFFHKDDREMVSESLRKTIELRTGFDFDARLLLADDDIVHVRSEGACEVGENGSAISETEGSH